MRTARNQATEEAIWKQQPIAGRSWMGMIHVEIMMKKLRETRSAMETGLHCLVDPVKLNCFVC
jgi:hypothetical protein